MIRRATRPRRAGALLALAAALLILGCGRGIEDGGVHVLTIDGVINPVTANYLDRGLDDAEAAGAAAVVLRLDTPGGLDSSMREIVQRIDAATVPVIVYVSPPGARAASAGAFITLAGHVAAMAPSTAIGAAHPVGASGEDIEGDLGAKVENDAAAYIRSIAEARGRNAEWAESAVRDSVSASAAEAVELGVVDFVGETLEATLTLADGLEVTLAGGQAVTVRAAGQPLRENPMTLVERFLLLISDPNIAFLLLSLGALAIVIELFNPSGFGLVVGALALIVAFFSLGTLPVNWAAVALILVAFVLFVAELFVTSGGLLGLAGAVALVLGGLFLSSSSNPEFEVSRWLVFGLPALIGASIGALALFVLRVRRQGVSVGREALVGLVGTARTAVTGDSDEGYVMVRGERWHARLEGGDGVAAIAPGERVVVSGVRGLHLDVRPYSGGDEAATPDGEAAGAREA